LVIRCRVTERINSWSAAQDMIVYNFKRGDIHYRTALLRNNATIGKDYIKTFL
jgi:hypothetical protein